MALDDQIRDVSDALTKRLRDEFDAEVRRLIGDLSASLEQERQTAAEEARRQSDAEAGQTLAVEVQKVRAETQQTLAQALAASRTEAEHRLEAELARVRAESQRTLDEERAARGATDQQVESAVAKVRAEARETIEKQLVAGRAEAGRRLEAEVVRVRAQAEHAYEAKLEAARAEAEERLTHEVARAQADARAGATSAADADERMATEVAGAQAEARRTAQAARQRMRAAVQRLDSASSLSELLDGLLAAVGADTARAALLLVGRDGFRGWGFDGFGPDVGDARALELAVNESGVIGAAMQKTTLATWQPGDEGSEAVPRFARLPTDCVAVAAPVRVGGRVVAVVYADDGGERNRPAASGWPELVEVLALHAGRCAESLASARWFQLAGGPTVNGGEADGQAGGEQATHREDAARRYARLLVSEIKLYNEAAVKAGQERRDLVARLRAEIERARRSYEERIAPDLAVRDAVFRDELVRTLADGDAGALGE